VKSADADQPFEVFAKSPVKLAHADQPFEGFAKNPVKLADADQPFEGFVKSPGSLSGCGTDVAPGADLVNISEGVGGSGVEVEGFEKELEELMGGVEEIV
jgi:hypothetical protein